MLHPSPLWPARLHHMRIDSDNLAPMVRFYREAMKMAARELEPGVWLMEGAERRVLLGEGKRNDIPYFAFGFESEARLADFRAYVQGLGINVQPSPSPLFGEEAFALDDPDGRTLVFGVPGEPGVARDALSGRLQHVVFATTQLPRIVSFYRDQLGFAVSDLVEEDGELTAAFFRSDEEHHSFAAFRAPEARHDHTAFETSCWNDIRDWGDHLAAMEIPIWWGPGRHGAGHNLFFMILDPDGNKVELSAELERMHRHMPHRVWKHEERTLNLWGPAWMRS